MKKLRKYRGEFLNQPGAGSVAQPLVKGETTRSQQEGERGGGGGRGLHRQRDRGAFWLFMPWNVSHSRSMPRHCAERKEARDGFQPLREPHGE